MQLVRGERRIHREIILSNRIYRLVIGALVLIFLYFDWTYPMLALIVMLLLEGLLNVRISRLVMLAYNRARASGKTVSGVMSSSDAVCSRLGLEAERVMSLVVGLILLVSYTLFYDLLWFFPWFLGFALLGSGASGVCPMLIGLKRFGLK